eukprot:2024309-Pyramimonas_sp.AAC.1
MTTTAIRQRYQEIRARGQTTDEVTDELRDQAALYRKHVHRYRRRDLRHTRDVRTAELEEAQLRHDWHQAWN